MKFKLILTENFKKEAKKLLQKYPSLKEELNVLGDELSANPEKGVHMGNHIYKIRLAVKSKGKGKRGGLRIMSWVKIIKNTVFLFSIYDKGKKDNISDAEINELIKDL